MKKENAAYIGYSASILIVTLFLSAQILRGEVRLPAGIMKKTGEFLKILTNTQSEGIKIGERLKSLNESEIFWMYRERHANEVPGNSLGFRDFEWQIEKPTDTYRIIALGDSMTEGGALSIENTWPKKLENKLSGLPISAKVEVLNMGIGGSGTFEEVERFKNIGLKYDPDMVILQYYPNDWLSPEITSDAMILFEKYKKGEYEFPPEIETELNASDYLVSMFLYNIVVKEYMERVDREVEWDCFVKKPLIELIDITKNKNIKLVVIMWDSNVAEYFEEKNKLVSFLKERQIPFYDFSESLGTVERCPSAARLPDCHLNGLGCEIVADQTMSVINETIIKEFCPCKEIGGLSGCRVRFLEVINDKIMRFRLVPGYEQIFDGFAVCIPSTTVKINSYGFRDYEYSIENPESTFRIVVLGDSITFGQGVELNESYPKVLEKLLNECGNGGYEVLNFGMPGANIAEKVEILKTKAIKFDPDLIVVQWLGDDAVDWNEYSEIEKTALQEFVKKSGKSEKDLTGLEKYYIDKKSYEEYLKELLYERQDEALERIEKSFEKLYPIVQNDSDVLIFIWEADKNQLPLLKEISKTYNWTAVDLSEILSEYPKNKMVINPEDEHPTAFAHKIIAEELYKNLLSSNLVPCRS